jgi:uncharacterized membrane protein YcaP (DUF421 family)
MHEYLAIFLRVSVMYVYVLSLMRLSGKRTLGHLSPLDFVITAMIGDFFDDVFWAEVPMAQGLVAITTLVLLHLLVSFADSRSRVIHRLVGSHQTLVIRRGRFVDAALSRERVGRDEVTSMLRGKGEGDLDEVRAAYMEPTDHLSVLKHEQAQGAQKKDLPALRELFR